MSHRRISGFVDPRTWERRELRDPDGPATDRQVLALYRAGALRLAYPGGRRFSKAEASAAIDTAVAAGLLEPRQPPDPRDPEERLDRVCRAILEHVAAHPGCSRLSVVEAVRGRRVYVAARVNDLIELGALEDRARRKGRGRRRELHVTDTSEERE